MNTNYIRRPLAAALCAMVHFSSFAGCVVVSTRDAVVRVGDSTVKVLGKNPMRFSKCEQLKVETGQVSVCYVPRGGQRTCSEIAMGAIWNMPNASDVAGDDSFGSSLLAIAKGDARTKFGQTRDLGQVAGMPYGRLLADRNLAVPLSTSMRSSVESLSVEALDSPDHEVITAEVTGQVAVFPKLLRSGERYRWRIRNAAGGTTGQFRTATQSDATHVGARIDALRAAPRSLEATALLTSEIYIEEGFPYNAYLELVNAGLKEIDALP